MRIIPPKRARKGSLLELLRRIGPVELGPREQPGWSDRRVDPALRPSASSSRPYARSQRGPVTMRRRDSRRCAGPMPATTGGNSPAVIAICAADRMAVPNPAFGRTNMRSGNVKRAPARPTPYEAAVAVGLIGCMEGPPDLALHHRKYARRAVRAKYPRAKRTP